MSTEPLPDIVLIHGHDLGRWLGVSGMDHVPSPRINRFAQDAVVFESAHAAAPLCSFIVRWPGGGVRAGAIVRSPHQLTHVLPTVLEAVGLDRPIGPDGHDIVPLEGDSFLDELRASGRPHREQPLFWEHCGNAAVRRGDWKLVRIYGQPWELYDLAADPTEPHDVIDEHRELAEELLELWIAWARRIGVRAFSAIVDLFPIRGADERAAQR